MGYIWHKGLRWIPSSTCPIRHIIACRHIWNVWRKVAQNISAWSCTFFISTRISMASLLKKNKRKIRTINRHKNVINDWRRIREGICQVIHRYATANNKYMRNYNKNVISSYQQYLNANKLVNLYGYDQKVIQKI